MRVFYYGNETLDKNSLGWKEKTVFNGTRGKIGGGGAEGAPKRH